MVDLEDAVHEISQIVAEEQLRQPIPGPVPLAFSWNDRLLLRAGPLAGTEIELLGMEWIRLGGRLYRKATA